jgi:anaerobic selenocysteine-containing dehydrogenase
MRQISRRDFLKLSGLALASLPFLARIAKALDARIELHIVPRV